MVRYTTPGQTTPVASIARLMLTCLLLLGVFSSFSFHVAMAQTDSDLPLQFQPEFQDLHARRFLVTTPNATVLYMNLDKGPADFLSDGAAFTKTSATVDHYIVNRVPADGWDQPTFPNYYIFPNASAKSCGSLMTGQFELSLFGENARAGLRIEVGPQAAVPQCSGRPQQLWSGLAYSTRSFNRAPLYSYLYSLAPPFEGFPPMSLPTSSMDLIMYYAFWFGDLMEEFTVLGTYNLNFIGNRYDSRATTLPTTLNYDAAFIAPNSDSFMIAKSATLGLGGSFVAVCQHGDLLSYDATFVEAGESVSLGAPILCDTFTSVDDLHFACDNRSDCIGFTTREASGLEKTDCMLISNSESPSSSNVAAWPRMLYHKPAAAPVTCSTKVSGIDARMYVYVEQASMSSGSVQVRVNGLMIAECGGSKPFANGLTGKDGECGTYYLCYVGMTPDSATVTVTGNGIKPSTCQSSLSVIFESTTNIDPIYPTYDVTDMTSSVTHKSMSVSLVTMKSYVHRATEITLKVLQNGFDCELYSLQNGGAPCPESLVTLSTETTCQSCGGSKGFYEGYPGENGYCVGASLAQYQFCGPRMSSNTGFDGETNCDENGELPPNGTYSGLVTITANVGKMVASSCPVQGAPFQGLLYATKPDPFELPMIPLFPLSDIFGVGVQSLFAVPLNTSHADLITMLNPLLPAYVDYFTGPLFEMGPASNRVMAYYVDWMTLYSSPQSNLRPNTTQICILDAQNGVSKYCSTYIPIGTTRIKVEVAQTDFLTNFIEVSISPGIGEESSTRYCGNANRFNNLFGQQDKCDTYLECLNEYVYDEGSMAVTSPFGFVQVRFSELLVPNSCDFPAVVMITFIQEPPSNFSGCAADEFMCDKERKCIPTSSVCNGIQDCKNNKDESLCTEWSDLGNTSFCFPADPTALFVASNDSTFEDCRRLAIIYPGTLNGFVVSESGVCSLYSSAATSILWGFLAASQYVCDRPNTNTFLKIFFPDSFDVCHRSVQCSGHGESISTLVDGVRNVPQLCYCRCDLGYTGTDCSVKLDLAMKTSLIARLSLTSQLAALDYETAAYGTALIKGWSLIQAVCGFDGIEGVSVSVAQLTCNFYSNRGVDSDVQPFFDSLMLPGALEKANEQLAVISTATPMLSFELTTSMSPTVSMPNCKKLSATSYTCGFSSAYDSFSVKFVNERPIISATIEYSEDGFTMSSETIECTLVPSLYRGICFTSTCYVNRSGIGKAIVNITNMVVSTDDAYVGACDTQAFMSAKVSYGNVVTTTNAQSSNEKKKYSSYLAGGIVVFVVGVLISWLIAIFFGARHISRKRKAMEQVDFTPMTEVERIKAIMLVDLAFEREIEETKSLRNDRWAVGFGVFGLMCGVGASFLVVYQATGRERESNFQVLYEEYSDPQCSAAFSSYMPTRIFAVPAGSNECDKMEVMGEAAGVAFATGSCSGSDGDYTVTYQGGSSKESCKESEPIVLSSGSCVPIQEIDPKSARNVYVQLRCSTTSQVAQRIAAIDSYVNGPDVFQDKQADALFPQTNLAANQPSSLGFVADYTIKTSSSNYPDTLDSQATPSDFDSNYDSQRIVMQTSGCSYLTGDAEACLLSTETSLLAQMNDLSGTAAITLGPTTQDAPIGYVLNGFGTSSQNTWIAAGSQAHRYFGAAGTAFDMGANFPTDRENPDDSEGYTISMYLRADSTTQGFAYAVCDAFEDSTTRVNHLLDRLGGMIAGGRGGRLWFNHTYKVYQSLYVDGPGKSLTFGYASPTLTDRLHLLEYDLSAIGMERVLNGLWHHVAIAFLVENGRVRAQLTVDGESSYTKAGWSVCVSEFPEPITRSFGASAPVFDRVVDIVTNGGMVVTGYFNGGIYALRAEAKPLLNTDFLQTGTQTMRDNNPFPRSKTLTLGIILLSVAGVAFIFLLVIGIVSLRSMITSTSARHCRGVAEEYYDLMKAAADGVLHADLAQKRPADALALINATDSHLEPLRFVSALRWTNLTPERFESVLFELKAQTPADLRPEALLLLLMKCKDPSLTKDSFTVANWNEAALAEESTRHLWGLCSGNGHTDAEKELEMCGVDFFAIYFGAAKATTTLTADGSVQFVDDGADNNKAYAAKVDVEYDYVVKNKAGEKGAGAAAELRGRGGGLTGGASDLKSNGSSFAQAIASVVGPLVGVFQVMYVWTTSIEFPSIYDDYFKGFFSFISVDFVTAFDNIGTLVTPLLQLFVALAAIAFVFYYMYEDNKNFERVLSQYIWRRDELETTEGKAMEQLSSLPIHLPAALADIHIAEPIISIEALPVSSSRRVDLFTGKIQSDNEPIDYKQMSEVQVETSDGQELTVDKADNGKLQIHNGEESKKFEAVGVCCQRHPTTRLSPQTQTQIWPFANPPTCCLEVNGQLCGEQCGVVYSCGLEYEDKETGEQRVCTYGLCEKHCRLSGVATLIAMIAGQKRRLTNSGFSWLLCAFLILVANVAYTPIMKTALMILGCHPYYQCEFEHCWDGIDQKFALAVFCSLAVVIIYGVGYPLSLFLVLLSRKRSMEVTFVAPEYEGRYASKEGGLFGAAGSYISEREWSRFVSTDATALAQQYQQVFYRWMFFPSITILFRVIALFPAIYLEPRSFEQRLGCAIVQLFVTAFMFGTTTQLSPVVLLTLRAAEVHNLIILGLQNISLVLLNDSNTDIGVALLTVTLLYIVFCCIVFVLTVVSPIVLTSYNKRSLAKFLSRFSFDNSATITLFANPFANSSVILSDKASEVGAMAASGVSQNRSVANEAQRMYQRRHSRVADVADEEMGTVISAKPNRSRAHSQVSKRSNHLFAAVQSPVPPSDDAGDELNFVQRMSPTNNDQQSPPPSQVLPSIVAMNSPVLVGEDSVHPNTIDAPPSIALYDAN